MTTTAPPEVKPADQAAVLELVQRVVKSWKAHDANTLSSVYTDDVSMILPGVHVKGRDTVEKFMTEAFASKWKGTEVIGVPLELRYLSDDVIMLLSQGGAYPPGSKEVPETGAIRAMWIFVKHGDGWAIAAYGNTPTLAAFPIPGA